MVPVIHSQPVEHGALHVEVAVAGGVPTEQPGMVPVIHRQPVAVAKSQVSVFVPDSSVTVSVSLVIHSHPVGAVRAVSNDPLGRGCRRPPGWLTVQEALILSPSQGDGHVPVALHAPHPVVALLHSEDGAGEKNKGENDDGVHLKPYSLI